MVPQKNRECFIFHFYKSIFKFNSDYFFKEFSEGLNFDELKIVFNKITDGWGYYKEYKKRKAIIIVFAVSVIATVITVILKAVESMSKTGVPNKDKPNTEGSGQSSGDEKGKNEVNLSSEPKGMSKTKNKIPVIRREIGSKSIKWPKE